MRRGVFVTGTDTGVGKTVAACALVHALRARGMRVAPMKPVAAGASPIDGRLANEDSVALLRAAGWSDDALGDVTPILLTEPMAPHIAAQREGVRIERKTIFAAFERLASRGDFAVVEGVGGFRVPLAAGFDASDLAREMGLPVVLVVGMRLGCLNHALLTELAIAAEGLPLAGWIANTIDPAMPVLEENIATLRERLQAPLLGILPHQRAPDAERLSRHLDVSSLLP
ncbi:ATP-dependent dethiobiotin synthetase BioD 1 [Usitatibacter rugosus]|uniref:ATP-dependent dethiobiotin synthetase BioD n=1 Tax=Usitatibacter rugosus TaxID=2732067 RepID=A0A6M4GQN8_9PROT|nr:dethiobiotin synthase [Usitatibacter rugosus]QJR09659.1 ATP-dependent dethiobiotin synthetase BioD 1 [Usitatibacter rugosus]